MRSGPSELSLDQNLKNYIEPLTNMFLEHGHGDNGHGDALHRTALAALAFPSGQHNFIQGILSCFREFTMINRKKRLYQAARSALRYREDDVSRDQIIMAFVALKLTHNEPELGRIAPKIPFRISRRFRMTPVLWIWIRAILPKSKLIWTYCYQFLMILELFFSVLSAKIIRRCLNLHKEFDYNYYMAVDLKKPSWIRLTTGRWELVPHPYDEIPNGQKLYIEYKMKQETRPLFRFFNSLIYPDYALHLTAWSVHITKKTFLKWVLNRLIIWGCENNNLLLRMLAGKKPDNNEILKYRSLDGWRWSSRLNGTCYWSDWPQGDDAKYNRIDKNILFHFIDYKIEFNG